MKHRFFVLSFIMVSFSSLMLSQIVMENINGRNFVSLNGEWNAIIDLYSKGEKMELYKDLKAKNNTQFYEYSFDDGLKLKVPGDWNSQRAELLYYESTIWYKRLFKNKLDKNKRNFIYFSGVNYNTKVYLNGSYLGKHEGGFTPFQFEITNKIIDGDNVLIVQVDNRREKNSIPAMIFDWWNYGGITRDVYLVETTQNYIRDYSARLENGNDKTINVTLQVDGTNLQGKEVTFAIQELNISKKIVIDKNGFGSAKMNANAELWCPENPKLYKVSFSFEGNRISDEIGFRLIERKGSKILLNGKPIFLKGINVHEEIPQYQRRAFSEEDAQYLLSKVSELGCNFLRLTHYVQNEHLVRLAEKKGLMMWEEIPIWQDIDFKDATVLPKAELMLKEMIMRDKNRAAIIFWSIANETKVSNERNKTLLKLTKNIRSLDNSRLLTASFDNVTFDALNNVFTLNDPLQKALDVISINKYLGWYMPWPCKPSEIKWSVATDKPLLFSEFGGEAKEGVFGDKNWASSWSEDFQEKLYSQNIEMFEQIPNLCGVCPWVLFDFRSPYRMHATMQNGWNRKGLLSDKGTKKKAWFVMKSYYKKLNR